MEIWLLRHAEAEGQAASGRDEDRALTREGAGRAGAVVKGLAALKPQIELVLTSPYRRARQTAEAAESALGLAGSLRDSRALEPGRDPEEILAELEAESCRSVLLVGHEPDLGALLGRIVSGAGNLRIPLRKAAVARVSWEGKGEGRLAAFLPPEVLERLAASSD